MKEAFVTWLAANKVWILVFLLMAAVSFLLLRLQIKLRDSAQKTIDGLLRTDPATAAERLENNRLLKTVFRKPVLELMKLDAYLSLGRDADVKKQIEKLDGMKLEPRDKLELYQRAVSFYAETGNGEAAKCFRDKLKDFLKKGKIENTEPYASVYEEADLIIGIYIDRDTSLIKKLVGRAQHTKNDVIRGVTQYRVAKLAYYKGDEEMMKTYLQRAEKNLAGTAYEPVIQAAFADPKILETK